MPCSDCFIRLTFGDCPLRPDECNIIEREAKEGEEIESKKEACNC